MAEYGIATYDANGKYNNYGIKPVSVVGTIDLADGQVSGSWAFTVPSGKRVGFVVGLDVGKVGAGRRIQASGNRITVSAASAVGGGVYSSSKCTVVVFLENA